MGVFFRLSFEKCALIRTKSPKVCAYSDNRKQGSALERQRIQPFLVRNYILVLFYKPATTFVNSLRRHYDKYNNDNDNK